MKVLFSAFDVKLAVRLMLKRPLLAAAIVLAHGAGIAIAPASCRSHQIALLMIVSGGAATWIPVRSALAVRPISAITHE